MKVIIAGSRQSVLDEYFQNDTWSIVNTLKKAIVDSGFDITEIIHGGCNGIDSLADSYAKENNIPTQRFCAYWKKHGKAAGPIRNEAMARYADALIAIRVNSSKGTTSMINLAKKYGLKTYIVDIPENSSKVF